MMTTTTLRAEIETAVRALDVLRATGAAYSEQRAKMAEIVALETAFVAASRAESEAPRAIAGYVVVDGATGERLGAVRATRAALRAGVERRNQAYGSYRYSVQPVWA